MPGNYQSVRNQRALIHEVVIAAQQAALLDEDLATRMAAKQETPDQGTRNVQRALSPPQSHCWIAAPSSVDTLVTSRHLLLCEARR